MKTFNEFINEGHQFLRCIGKNDNINIVKTFGELKTDDWLYTVDEEDTIYATRVYGQDVYYNDFCAWNVHPLKVSDGRQFNGGYGVKDETSFIAKRDGVDTFIFYTSLTELMEKTNVKDDESILVFYHEDDDMGSFMSISDFKKKYLNEDV